MRVKYGRADLKWATVLETGALYTFVSFPFLGRNPVSWKRSLCLESLTVRSAKLRQILSLRSWSGSNPSWRSWPECDGSHRPVMAAMAIRCALSRSLAWLTVRPLCQTGQANSRWTLPSAFQKSTKVCWSTPNDCILLRTHVVWLALWTIFST